MTTRHTYHYNALAQTILTRIDQARRKGALDGGFSLSIFAELCHAIVGGKTHTARKYAAGLEPVLERLVEEMSTQYPRKPEWLVGSEIILHLSERLLGCTTEACEADLVPKLAVQRTRSAHCGTYSTPDFVADQITKTVLTELGSLRARTGHKPVEIIDLSLEAGHFALSLIGQAPLGRVHFYGLDRDPQAIDLASLLLRKAVRLSNATSVRAKISLGDSILDPLPRGFPDSFDAVIGNPPWKTGHPTDRDNLFEIFRPKLTARFDVYLAFILRADALLRPGGLLGVVVPSGFMYNLNARQVRAHLLEHYEPLRLDVYRRRTFVELPSVAPIGIVLRKKKTMCTPHRNTTIVIHSSFLGPNGHDTVEQRKVCDEWRRHPNSVFCHVTEGGTAWAERRKGRVLLADLGSFSSGARLSAVNRVATPKAFVGITASCLRPFHACEYAATHYKKGDKAFERCPPLEHLLQPKVLFQTIRCVSLTRRLIAASAGQYQLACSTTGMMVPSDVTHAKFIVALMNSTVANAWYKTNDCNRAIKISVLKDLPIPVDEALWTQIAAIGSKIERLYRQIHCAGDECRVGDNGVELTSRSRQVYERISALGCDLDGLVFDLYGVGTAKRAKLIALSDLKTF